jgi:hypothetical protein
MLLLLPLTAAAIWLYLIFKPPAQPELASPFTETETMPEAGLERDHLPAVVTVHAAPILAKNSAGE